MIPALVSFTHGVVSVVSIVVLIAAFCVAASRDRNW